MAATMHDLLTTMIERGASDLHITTGTSPQIRVDGKLTPAEPVRAAHRQDTKQLAYSVLTDAQKHKFEEDNELDLSFGIKGLARFRCNVFHAARRGGRRLSGPSPSRSRPSRSWACRRSSSSSRKRPRGLVLVTGPDRLGQVDHARRDDRQDQHRAPRAHHDDRGPDRVPAPAQEVPGEPARGGRGHALVQDRAQVHPPPGPGRRARRRDARPRDDRGRADASPRPATCASAPCTPTRAAQTINRIIDVFPPHQQAQVRAQLSLVLEGVHLPAARAEGERQRPRHGARDHGRQRPPSGT